MYRKMERRLHIQRCSSFVDTSTVLEQYGDQRQQIVEACVMEEAEPRLVRCVEFLLKQCNSNNEIAHVNCAHLNKT